MLKIKNSHHFSLPRLSVSGSPLQFKPIPIDENDELSRAIIDDTATHDDQWELNERPDMGELTAFWSEVEADVAKDPEWFRFSED
jgi:hypothetical protein